MRRAFLWDFRLYNGQRDSTGKILGVGVVVSGIVDSQHNTIDFAPLIGIQGTADCSEIFKNTSATTHLKTYIENDVNAAAFGEQLYRKLPLDGDLLYISLDTGLGARLILNGKLRKGINNAAGEMGCMVFDKDFQTKHDRAGRLEAQINRDALQSHWGRGGGKEDVPSSEHQTQIIDLTASLFALCIANYSALLDTATIVIDRITVERLGEPLLKVAL